VQEDISDLLGAGPASPRARKLGFDTPIRQVARSCLQARWRELISLAQVDFVQLLTALAIGVPIPLLFALLTARGKRAAALILKAK
jgi:hypothetical protein